MAMPADCDSRARDRSQRFVRVAPPADLGLGGSSGEIAFSQRFTGFHRWAHESASRSDHELTDGRPNGDGYRRSRASPPEAPISAYRQKRARLPASMQGGKKRSLPEALPFHCRLNMGWQGRTGLTPTIASYYL